MSAVAAPADRRFHRARVKPGRRRSWWTFLKPAIKYAGVVLVLAYAVYRGMVGHAGTLQIDHIVVRGNAQLSTGEVLAVLSGLQGQNLLWMDLETWRQQLLKSPWVRDAALRRSLPSTVEVAISEREPIGIGRVGGGLYLLDDHGGVIDEYGPRYADFDLPIVDGLTAAESGRVAADEDRAALAARLVQSLKPKPDVARRLSQVDVRDVHNAAVVLAGDPAVIYVGEERFLQRLESYLDLSGALRERVPDIDYVDLRFEGQIYVRPAGTTGKSGAVKVRR